LVAGYQESMSSSMGRSTGREFYWSPRSFWSENSLVTLCGVSSRDANCCAGKEMAHAECQTETPRDRRSNRHRNYGTAFEECVLTDPLDSMFLDDESPSLSAWSDEVSTSDRDEDERDEECEQDPLDTVLDWKPTKHPRTEAVQADSVKGRGRAESAGSDVTLGEERSDDPAVLFAHATGLSMQCGEDMESSNETAHREQYQLGQRTPRSARRSKHASTGSAWDLY